MLKFSKQSHRMRNKAYSFSNTISVQDIKATVEKNILDMRQRLVAPKPPSAAGRNLAANYKTAEPPSESNFYQVQARKYSEMIKISDPSNNLPTTMHRLNSKVLV
jgi:hypothetical protein